MSKRFRIVLPAALTALAAAAALFGGGAQKAEALPPYAAKEGKPCTYCHQTPAGGVRNYRGVFYAANDHTFKGFDDAAEAKKAGTEIGPEATPPPKSLTPAAGNNGNTGSGAAKSSSSPSAAVKSATTKMTAARAAYMKAKANPARKKAYAASLASLAHATMMDESQPPAKRYPAALKLANQALSLDPKNKTALADKKAIEGVYKQMGRPIPK